MVTFFQVECPKCKSRNRQGARYCGQCGEALPGGEIKCRNCGETVAADKAFCGNCGKPLSESAAPLMTGNRWARRANDFATKVEVDDVEGFFKRGLIVEGGTQAIFFVNGAYSGILEPGRYDMGGLVQRVKNLFNYKSTTAVLVDTGDVELQFSLADLPTNDPIRLAAECRLVAQLENPTQFFENMMKGRQNYTLSEMRSFLEGELRNCLLDFVGSKSVQELSTNLAFKQQMEQGIAQHLASTFSRKGLAFIQVRVFNFRHPRMDAVTNKKEEYWLHAQDLQTTLAGEGSTMGLERRLLDQETAGMLMKLEVYEDRSKVYERMRKAVASEQMDEIIHENELEKFLQNIDKDKLLRADEMRALVQGFGERKEDHDLARKFLIQKLQMDQKSELERAALAGQINFKRMVTEATRAEEEEQIKHEQRMQGVVVDSRLEQEKKGLTHAVEAKKLEEMSAIEIEEMRSRAEEERKRRAAKGDIEETEDSLRILERIKERKQQDAEREAERVARIRAMETERTMKEESQKHRQEMEKLDKFGTLSLEALIAAAPAEKAAMLAELKRAESLRGFSEEQILAMAADKSPEIAKAFQEKFRSSSAADIQRAYDQLLAVKDKAMADVKELSREQSRIQQEMFNRALDTQRDTATAAARSAQPATTVITPGSGIIQAGGAFEPAAQRRKVVCPECHLETTEGQKFCENCGHKFFG